MIHRLLVKSKPACAADCGLPAGHSITVHVMRGRGGSISVRSDHIPWLVAYAVDELNNQGVDQLGENTELEGNVPAVADCYIEWNFHAHAWESQFIAGPHKGVTRAVGPHHPALRTQQEELKERGMAPEGDESTWSYYMRKKIAYQFLKAWNSSIVSGEEDSFRMRFGDTDEPDKHDSDPVKSAVAAPSAMVQPKVAEVGPGPAGASEKPAVADTEFAK